MGRIILDLAVTLDGFVSGPNGEIDWLVKQKDLDFGDILAGILEGVDAILYGRISYELWGNYQPGAGASQKLKDSYKLLHTKAKYVVSRTSKASDGRATFIHADLEENLIQIKQKIDGDIWLYGGGQLVSSIVNLGLVDIYQLAIHPVIIGKGVPLFKGITRRTGLRLTESIPSKSGVILVKYETNGLYRLQ